MKVLRLLPLAGMIGALAAPVHAEGLLELYQAAQAYDATWQSARSTYDATVYRGEQARAGLLPQAGLSAGISRSTLQNTSVDHGFTTQQAAISASQPLYRPANVATFRQAERQVELAQSQLTAASQDLMIRVSQAYFDVLAAQDTLAFVRAQKAATAEQLASAKRNFEVGTSTITDTREAQARYDLVILDAPPAAIVSDAIPLIKQVSGVLVVARLRRSRRDAAERLREQLMHLHAKPLGVVVNGIDPHDGVYGSAYVSATQYADQRR